MSHRVAWLVAGAAALAWTPFITAPVSPDEGGFLLVASQWRPGGALYGHYWVDRPPLLLTIFDLAAHAGGAMALRLIGIAAVLASVVIAGRIGRLATGRTAVIPVVVAGAFLTTPLFGTGMVNGELLAVPLVLAGILALLKAWTVQGARAFIWAGLAGAAAAAAPMVKQNVVDVFVLATVLVLQSLRGGRRHAFGVACAFGAGGALITLGLLLWADAHGTEPTYLWDALVTFRGEAATVIDRSSTSSTSQRFVELLGAAALSGAPLLLVVMLLRLRGKVTAGRLPDLRYPALLLLLWELVAVGAGGSYWLHYLIGVVPGLVLVSVAATQRPPALRRWTVAVVAISCLSSATSTVAAAVNIPLYSADAEVAAYLRTHGTPHDTVVVGFGHPDIVWDSGLRSPYRLLWSLPVRVLDPRLQALSRVMSGHRAPTWVVVNGSSLATWGVDATAADSVLDRRYDPVTTIGPYVVWRLSS